ncbi:hypothetical protein VTL71DRAFT_6682 [Oculimacula yallundae]|uniref:Uncharacterized protein n=1 Tax=Oculimacula yallundae TaxID=86028 RepID=A0ABR4BZ71_9HELO
MRSILPTSIKFRVTTSPRARITISIKSLTFLPRIWKTVADTTLKIGRSSFLFHVSASGFTCDLARFCLKKVPEFCCPLESSQSARPRSLTLTKYHRDQDLPVNSIPAPKTRNALPFDIAQPATIHFSSIPRDVSDSDRGFAAEYIGRRHIERPGGNIWAAETSLRKVLGRFRDIASQFSAALMLRYAMRKLPYSQNFINGTWQMIAGKYGCAFHTVNVPALVRYLGWAHFPTSSPH